MGMRCQFNFNGSMGFIVQNEGTGIIRAAEEGGLSAEAEANGAEDGGFSGSVGAADDIEASTVYIV